MPRLSCDARQLRVGLRAGPCLQFSARLVGIRDGILGVVTQSDPLDALATRLALSVGTMAGGWWPRSSAARLRESPNSPFQIVQDVGRPGPRRLRQEIQKAREFATLLATGRMLDWGKCGRAPVLLSNVLDEVVLQVGG
jgi:hypothetical protein